MRLSSHTWINSFFGFPGESDDAIAINYCVLYDKHLIYRAKINNQNEPTIDFLTYLSHLKYVLKIEKSICIGKNQRANFENINNIYDTL